MCRWLLPADKSLDDTEKLRYDQIGNQTAQWQNLPAPKQGPAVSTTRTKKKKTVPLPDGRVVYFLMDLETTGSKRNWDRGIEYCVIAHDVNASLLGTFVRRVNNDEVRVKPSAYAVHGISGYDLKNEPPFSVVGVELNKFFTAHLQDYDAGVLVAHNGSTDFQFLCCDMQRAGLVVPSKLSHTICTLQTIKRFSSLAYRKAKPEEWTVLTAKGNTSMSIDACDTFVLSNKRSPPGNFERDYGRHHEAFADVKGVATILFDHQELGDQGLWYKIFKSKFDVCVPLAEISEAMTIKMASPVVQIEPLPSGWVCDDDGGCKTSGDALPEDVMPTPEPHFVTGSQRGEGDASPILIHHLKDHVQYSERHWQVDPPDLMFASFIFFFQSRCWPVSHGGLPARLQNWWSKPQFWLMVKQKKSQSTQL